MIRQQLALEVYDQFFALFVEAVHAKKLLRGKHLAIDTAVLGANAPMRSLTHRMTGEKYRQYVKRLAEAAGTDPTDPRAVSTVDRKRPGRTTSNDVERRVAKPARSGRERRARQEGCHATLIYKPEHTLDLETGGDR